jgi:WD40 repeat protein
MKIVTFIFIIIVLTNCTVKNQSCTIAKSFEGHSETILGITQSPNGKYLLSGGDDQKAILWNEKGEIIFKSEVHKRAVNDVTFLPDNQRFITAGSDETFIIWNINGTKIKTVFADKIYVKTVVYSHDGKFILICGGDKLQNYGLQKVSFLERFQDIHVPFIKQNFHLMTN